MKIKYTVEPKRAMTRNFTERTLARSKQAKTYGQRKEFSMKNFIKQPAGALIALAVVAFSSVGAYAAINWFDGQVRATQKNDIISVDLTGCKDSYVPGFPDNQDMSNVEFKILGTPHISATDLEQKLLIDCEFKAVIDFYQSKPETSAAHFHPGKIVAANNNTITFAYYWGGEAKQKEFTIKDASFLKQGAAISAGELNAGQYAVLVTPGNFTLEGTDPLDDDSSVLSIFVTQYDVAMAPMASKTSFNYDSSNIMPLNMYNDLQQ